MNMSAMSSLLHRPPSTAEVCHPKPSALPLSRVQAGSSVRIKAITAPPGISQRLREIGFVEDQVIKLLVRQSNLICLVANARMALSSQLAQMILVEPVIVSRNHPR